MTGKERLIAAINHQKADRPPIDMGSTSVTGMHVDTIIQLRQALGLPDKPVKVFEVFQQLGLPENDLLDALGVDVVGLNGYYNFIGVPNLKWKKYLTPCGQQGLISENFKYDVLPDGSRIAYPQGNRTVAPSFHMPAGGYFLMRSIEVRLPLMI